MNLSRTLQPKVPQANPLVHLSLRTARHCVGAVLDTLYPLLCVHCSAPCPKGQRWLCARCQAHLLHNATSRKPCLLCGMSPHRGRCACDRGWEHPYESVHALFDFDPVVRSLVHEIKYRHKASLARFIMGHFCSVIPSAVLDNIDYLLPVPLHGRRYRHRGYNQAAHLALGLCHTLPECPPLLDKVLKRTHYTRTQTKMDSSQRARNMQGVFALSCAAKGLIGGKHLVVVDDVVTTGATSGAVAGALLEGGAASVSVLCLARD